MKVATVIRLLKGCDQQADVVMEVVKGKTRTRYHARDVIAPHAVATSTGTKLTVIITNE